MPISLIKTDDGRRVDFDRLKILIGGGLINLPTCLFNMFGNFYPYLYSYVYFILPPESIEDFNPSWIMPGFLIFRSIAILSAYMIKRRIGLLKGIFWAILLQSVTTFLTYFTSQHSVWTIFISVSVGYGLANGLLLSFVLAVVASRFDKDVGLASGIAMSFSAVGSILFNFMLTGFLNPDNLSSDVGDKGLTFFSQRVIVDKVPLFWIIFGIITTSSQGLGFCLIAKTIPNASLKQTSTSKESLPRYDVNNMNIGIRNDKVIDGTEHWQKGNVTNKGKVNSSHNSKECCNERTELRSDVKQIDEGFHPNGDVTLKDSVKTASFYVVWLSAASLAFYQLIAINYYKMFGQIWIADDWFLTLTGSVSAIFLFVTRLSMGKMVDRFGAKNTYIWILSVGCTMMLLWYFTAMLDRWLFLLWTDTIIGLASNNSLLMPIAVLKLYGQTDYILIFGILQTSVMFADLLFPPLFSVLIENFGWFWIFLMGACVTFVPLVLTVVFFKKDTPRRNSDSR